MHTYLDLAYLFSHVMLCSSLFAQKSPPFIWQWRRKVSSIIENAVCISRKRDISQKRHPEFQIFLNWCECVLIFHCAHLSSIFTFVLYSEQSLTWLIIYFTWLTCMHTKQYKCIHKATTFCTKHRIGGWFLWSILNPPMRFSATFVPVIRANSGVKGIHCVLIHAYVDWGGRFDECNRTVSCMYYCFSYDHNSQPAWTF